MSLLPINPADFPDVPTKKALIAIDFQNDFLADDGALPVSQPDGMIANVVRLADAVRNSGYGEVVWVRSQFDTSRAVGEQQMMAADTPQIPSRSDGSAAAAAARARSSRPSPGPSTAPEADPEAFLSEVSGQVTTAKPQCVRKGTKGAELVPELAAAKGPRDYAMTKSYYSAFQSGQLLQLLRRHFATELYICGALSNVSVYATALAASSYGFDITIVEDCCGYRSKARHMNATRKLAEMTGCEFATVSDIVPTLRPRPQSKSDSAQRARPSAPMPGGPANIPPELIAAAMAGNRLGPSKGITVRPKSPESQSRPNAPESTGGEGKSEDAGAAGAADLPLSLSPDLAPEMEKLRLNAETTDSTNSHTHKTTTAGVVQPLAADEASQPKPVKSQAKQAIQPVVKRTGSKAERKILTPRANAQGTDKGSLPGQKEPTIGAPRNKLPSDKANAEQFIQGGASSKTGRNPITSAEQAMKQFFAPKTSETVAAKSKPTATKMDKTDFVPSENLLTAETPDTQKTGSYPNGSNDNKPLETLPDTKVARGAGDKAGPDNSSDVPADTEDLCEGDTSIIHSFLPDSLASGLFERLCSEVHFKKMMHQGGEVPRFVAVQGELLEDGTQPIYRHPSDETPLCVPFTPAVEAIRTQVEATVGHKVNHVLIQCYRSGNDYISEHSDKTLDVALGSYIANVSLGSERTMVFRTKRDASTEIEVPSKEEKGRSTPSSSMRDSTAPPAREESSPSKRQTIRCRMSHNSLVRMGLATNGKWLHGIRPDKRPTSQKSEAELAYGGYRISLTFRHIGTFLSPTENADEPVIWGQGAVSKTRDGARPVLNGQTPEAVTLLKAFGKENHSSDFNWAETYGGGFDVLHMKTAPRYFGCGDTMVDGRVKIMLAELGVNYAHGSIGTGKGNKLRQGEATDVVPVKFVLDDADRTTITGDVAIMLYLDARYPKKKGSEAYMARVFTRFQAAIALGQKWKALAQGALASDTPNEEKVKLISDFASVHYVQFNDWMAENLFPLWVDGSSNEDGDLLFAGNCAGQQPQPTIADYALWPILYDMTETWRSADARFEQSYAERARYTALEKYFVDFSARKSVVEVFGPGTAWLSAPPSTITPEKGSTEQGEEQGDKVVKKDGRENASGN
jgi:nicotinamidase-related amidase/alkylated DNA repair dioxygenase AlkB